MIEEAPSKVLNKDLRERMGNDAVKAAKVKRVFISMGTNDLWKDAKSTSKDYISYVKNMQGNLKNTLDRLKKCNIIEFYPVYKARIKLDREVKKQVKTIIGKEEGYYYSNLD